MVCTGNRQAPSFAFSANERERAEGAGLKDLGLRCQWERGAVSKRDAETILTVP